MPKVIPGLCVFQEEGYAKYKHRRLGLLCNQASINPDYTHAVDVIDKTLPGALVAIFGPQHGLFGEKQDNMVPSPHFLDPNGRPVFSLYGDVRVPLDYMLEGLDAVLVDLPDVGCRVYTFAHTLRLLMESASQRGIEIVILDRPNPIGGLEREGNLLDEDCVSFVGLTPIPMRHGLSLGELALFMNHDLRDPVKLTIIPAKNWSRGDYFQDSNLPWVMPSPNLPTPECAHIYPGTVIFEGTNLSEGRGTTRPFHLVGAPFIDSKALKKALDQLNLPDVIFREVSFQPCFHKWCGMPCPGVEIHPTGRGFKPYLTALSILQIVLRHHREDFALKEPPYEYDYERRPIDLILGRNSIFDSLSNGVSAMDLALSFEDEIKTFEKDLVGFLIYA
ncbi:MAG: DUF1343 domain-containing protein [Deltaproteobacteria bacterium]|jgi:uncharacterized protein YbbC (DUF1343 family)|nr:DUF1343 domain-containing protein [Deltaproteobacteria bacterium]